MDFITHGLISFLLSHNFGLNYVSFAIIMGIFPDFDIILVPLAHRYNNLTLYHRGGVHSLFILGLANFFGALIINSLNPGNFLLYFGLGFLCSSMHLFCDILTTFPIRPFWPFYKKGFKLNISEAVNIFGVFFSAGAGILFFNTYYLSPSPFFPLYVQIISILLISFILAHLIVKWYLHQKFSSIDHLQTLPTAFPFKWKLIQKKTTTQNLEIRFGFYNIFSRKEFKFHNFSIDTTPTTPPITSSSQAVQFSFQLPEVRKHLWRTQIPLYCIESSNASWKIYWFSAEMLFFSRTYAIMIALAPSGQYSVKSGICLIKNCISD